MTQPDEIRVAHMREAARKAVEFCRGRSRADLETDELLRLALSVHVETNIAYSERIVYTLPL